LGIWEISPQTRSGSEAKGHDPPSVVAMVVATAADDAADLEMAHR
jgi:hypothetical protein